MNPRSNFIAAGTFLLLVFITVSAGLNAQDKNQFYGLDMMLIKGDYQTVIDTCRKILSPDDQQPEIWYILGLAYQNVVKDDLALESFKKAASIKPDERKYNLMLAKAYYGKGKFHLAEPLFTSLLKNDSLSWVSAFYLTSIYMQDDRFDESIKIYDRFIRHDPADYIVLDKKGFALLKKEEYDSARIAYEKSMKINPKNTSAIKNLAYIYSLADRKDTSIYLLSKGIEIDSSDIDLYYRRAQLYFSIEHFTRAAMDYTTILAKGDSSKIYLKKAGICYCYIRKPATAIRYLLLAYRTDTSDYETCSYLGQSYYNLKDMKNSIKYYSKVIDILAPITEQTKKSYVLLAESLKGDGQYKEALEYYQRAQQIKTDPNIYLIIANLYDEQFKDKKSALRYYQLFMGSYKTSSMAFTDEYIESIRKRIEYIKEELAK